jgi:hypothetical protein
LLRFGFFICGAVSMIIVALLCLICGGMLGLFYKVLALVPVNMLAGLPVLGTSFFFGDSLTETGLKIGVQIVSFAAGYLLGSALACAASSAPDGLEARARQGHTIQSRRKWNLHWRRTS